MSRGVGPIPKWGVCNALGPLKGPLGCVSYPQRAGAVAVWDRRGARVVECGRGCGRGRGRPHRERRPVDPPIFLGRSLKRRLRAKGSAVYEVAGTRAFTLTLLTP